MSLKLPKFAQEFLNRIARENGFTNFSMEISSGSQPGDGFNSDLYRIKITENGSSKTLELLTKLHRAVKIDERNFYQTNFSGEKLSYTNI